MMTCLTCLTCLPWQRPQFGTTSRQREVYAACPRQVSCESNLPSNLPSDLRRQVRQVKNRHFQPFILKVEKREGESLRSTLWLEVSNYANLTCLTCLPWSEAMS